MTETLTIDRIIAGTSDAHGAAERVERIIRRVAEDRLEQMAGSLCGAGPGDWCLPGVSVAAVLDFARPDSALEETVARAVLDAIAEALHSPAAVHYPNTVDALAGLVVAVATRRFSEGWVWSQLGFIADAGDMERQPLSCVLGALAAHPEYALGALIRAVAECGFAALHRLLGETGWCRLAEIVLGATGGVVICATTAAALVGAGDKAVQHNAGESTRGQRISLPPQETRPDRTGQHLAASRIVAVSRLAAAVRGSRLRLEGPGLRALVVLMVAESEPAALWRPTAGLVCLAVADVLTGVVPLIAETGSPATEVRPADRHHQAAAVPGKIDVSVQVCGGDIAPDAEPEPRGDETHWAGLLFLLNVAEDAGMPGALLADPDLDGIAAPELLARMLMMLAPVASHDPVVFAFAGVDPRRSRCTWDHPLAEPLADRVRAHAGAWASAMARRLGREDAAAQCLVETACRTGWIARDQGWMEIHLDLESVDIGVRRAGLDIDPGWVPWLGSVVRFCYG